MAQGRDDNDERRTILGFAQGPAGPVSDRTPPPGIPEEATERVDPTSDGETLAPTDSARNPSFSSSTTSDDGSPDRDLATSFHDRMGGVAEPCPGEVLFGRYLVVEQLGKGGMGTVWLVRHLEFDSERALKLIVSGIDMDAQTRARFKREARIMDRLSHPNAVRVYDARLGEGTAFIEMEYIRGESLNKLLQPGHPMPMNEVVAILDPLCDVLQAANDEGIIHRDLKPSNLMFVEGRTPGKKVLKLLDFGIAKIRDSGESEDLKTVPGLYIGTLNYSSPEQIRGDEVDTRSDLYSVGVLLYELLTGHRPFSGGSNALIANQLFAPPPPFAEKNPEAKVPPAIEQVVMACLAKDPIARPQSPHELKEMFHQALAACGLEEARGPYTGGTGVMPPTAKKPAADLEFPSQVGTLPRDERAGSRWLLTATTILLAVCLAVIVVNRFYPLRSLARRLGLLPKASATAPSLAGKGGAPAVVRPSGGNPEVDKQELAWLSEGLEIDRNLGRNPKGWPNALIRSRDGIEYQLDPESGLYLPQDYSADKELDPNDGKPKSLLRKSDGAKFVRLAGGSFQMGNLDDAAPKDDPSVPAHPVMLSSFYMQTTEVTNGEIENFLRGKALNVEPEWRLRYKAVQQWLRDDESARKHPAVRVNYLFAKYYAQKKGGRLPSEAQWEFAARSGGQPYPYVWSYNKNVTSDESLSRLANIAGGGDGDPPTKAVGSYPIDTTFNGVMDLAGNVREICRDVFKPYPRESTTQLNPEVLPDDPKTSEFKLVVRGGCFSDELDRTVTTNRGEPLDANDFANTIGFRIVIECPEIPSSAR